MGLDNNYDRIETNCTVKVLHSHFRKNTDKRLWARTYKCDPCAALFVGLNVVDTLDTFAFKLWQEKASDFSVIL